MKKVFNLMLISLVGLLLAVSCTPEEKQNSGSDGVKTPANLNAEIDGLSFVLTWDAVENAVNYTVDFGGKEQNVPENSFSATVESPGNYNVRVKANAEDGTSSEYASYTISIKSLGKLAAPETLYIDEVGDTYISVSWDPVENAESYTYYFTNAVDGSIISQDVVTEPKASFTDLTPASLFNFELQATSSNVLYESSEFVAMTLATPNSEFYGTWEVNANQTLLYELEGDNVVVSRSETPKTFNITIEPYEEEGAIPGLYHITGLSSVDPSYYTVAEPSGEPNVLAVYALPEIGTGPQGLPLSWCTIIEYNGQFAPVSGGGYSMLLRLNDNGTISAESIPIQLTVGGEFESVSAEVLEIDSASGYVYFQYTDEQYPVNHWALDMSMTKSSSSEGSNAASIFSFDNVQDNFQFGVWNKKENLHELLTIAR